MSSYYTASQLLAVMDEFIQNRSSWEDAFDRIFDGPIPYGIVQSARHLGIEYYDPDSSYEEDVMAFYRAVKQYCTPSHDEMVSAMVSGIKEQYGRLPASRIPTQEEWNDLYSQFISEIRD